MESERITRKSRIDPLLKSLGWDIVPFREEQPLDQLSNCAIEEYETENGPADYVLCVDGRILAVVETKKLTLGPQNVLTQAERYSRGVAASKLNNGNHYSAQVVSGFSEQLRNNPSSANPS